MKRVIITGATGAIGTALINEFVNNNIEVLVFTRKESKRNNNIINNKLVKILYCSLNEIEYQQNNTGTDYDCFFHLAWAGASGEARNDKTLQEKNVEYAVNAVECAKRFGCNKFIGIGSQAEYGLVNEPLTTKTETNPVTEYGKAKLLAGQKTKAKAEKLGLEFNWIRVLSIYGPNDGDNTLISYLVKTMKKNEDVHVTKCEQIWDYLYSEDAASAIKMVAEKGVNGKTYVLGSGKALILKEYVETIKKIIKSTSNIEYGYLEYSNNQVMCLYANISEIVQDIKWLPKTSFSSGITTIINKQYENN